MILPAKLPPVFHLDTVADLLHVNSAAVMDLIDSGKILFAWNVSAPRASRREIRILSSAVRDYLESKPSSVATLGQAVASILTDPGKFPAMAVIKASVFRRRLRVEHQLMGQLIRAGELKCKSGPRRPVSAILTWESCSAWLHRRSLGPQSYAPIRPQRKGLV